MRQILLIILGLSVSLFADFTRDKSTQIVTDNSTGLQWQDDVNISNNWTYAIDYCEALKLGGHIDWRLPNFNELYYLADRSKSNPAMDSTFQNVVPNFYWSSTTIVGEDFPWAAIGKHALGCFFNNGGGNWDYKSYSNHVRCVRDGQ